MKTKRSSNIELLRVISMIWIMLSHCISYGLKGVDTFTPNIYADMPITNKLFCAICSGGGDIGVGIFFIITGYFLASSKKNRNVVPLIKQVYFYGILCTLIAVIGKLAGVIDVDAYTLLSQTLIPLFGTWWFVAAYFFLVFLSVSINMLLDERESKGNKKIWLLVFLVAAWYSVGLVTHSSYYPLLRGVFYYMLGAMSRRNEWKVRKNWCWPVFIISAVLYSVLSMYSYGHGEGLATQGIRFAQFCIISPVSALSLFMLMEAVEMKHSKAVNMLGASSFGVYLFHEAPYNRTLLWNVIVNPERASTEIWMPLYCVVAVVIIYAVVVGIEQGRERMRKKLVQ